MTSTAHLTVEQIVDQAHLDRVVDLVNTEAYVAGIAVYGGTPHSPERHEMYFTFGSQYSYEPHPSGSWVHPDGFLTVEYGETEPSLARMTAWHYLAEGKYAFDYGDRPDKPDEETGRNWYPRGELRRIVLP